MTPIVPVIALGLLLCPALHAMPLNHSLNYSITTANTAVALSWHAFGSISQAHLQGVTGEVRLNAGYEMDDRINVTIPVATLTASNSLLTYQMKSRLFFDAAHYPTIVFTSSRVVSLGHGRFRVFGTLEVKNVQRPVILDARLEEQSGTLPEQGLLSLHAATAISRSAFNMDSFAALVGDRVAINIDLQAIASSAVFIPSNNAPAAVFR